MTADDDDIDDASLKSMRAVWLSMREEEPPAAGMSGLLAAAREQAESMRETPAWWQRLFTQLRRPPALAFATVMLLVGGAVLVTRSVDHKVPSETATVAPAGPDELRSREVTRNLEEEKPATLEVQQNAPVIAEPTDPAPDPVKQAPKPRPKKEVVVGGSKVDDTRKRVDEVGPNEPNRNDRFDSDAAKSGFAEGKDTSTTELESPGRVEPTTTAQPPPEPAPRGQATQKGGEQVTVTDSGKSSTPPNEQLARQAESAASRKDCPAVRVIVGRLKKQDESFYKTRLGKNAAVTKCL